MCHEVSNHGIIDQIVVTKGIRPYALCHDEEAAANYQGMAAIDENWASGAWAPVRKLDGSIVTP